MVQHLHTILHQLIGGHLLWILAFLHQAALHAVTFVNFTRLLPIGLPPCSTNAFQLVCRTSGVTNRLFALQQPMHRLRNK